MFPQMQSREEAIATVLWCNAFRRLIQRGTVHVPVQQAGGRGGWPFPMD